MLKLPKDLSFNLNFNLSRHTHQNTHASFSSSHINITVKDKSSCLPLEDMYFTYDTTIPNSVYSGLCNCGLLGRNWTIVSLAVAGKGYMLYEQIVCEDERSFACLKQVLAVGYLGVPEFVNGSRQLLRVIAPQSLPQPQV